MSEEVYFAPDDVVAEEKMEYSWGVCVIISGQIILKSKVKNN